MTRVLVTGAAGFIGSHVVEALLDRGEEVVGVDNFDPFYGRPAKERNLRTALAHPRFAFHDADILEADRLATFLEPETVVIHLAAKAGVRPSLADPEGYMRANVEGTAAVARAAHVAGVRRVVFGSSSSIYGDDTPVPFREDAAALRPVSPYAASKRAAELFLEAVAPIWGLRVLALRFFTVFGPRQRPDLAIHTFTRRIVAGEPLTLFGDGSQSRDYTYCDDIVAGVLAGIDWTADAPVGVEYVNLGGSHPVRLGLLVDTIAKALDRTPAVEWRPMQPGDVQQTYADVSKAERLLRYLPTIDLTEGIERFVAWYRETHDHEP